MTSMSRRMRPRRKRPLPLRAARLGLKTTVILVITALAVPAAAAGVAISTLLFTDLPGNLPERKPAFVARPSHVFDASGREIGEYNTFELTVPTKPEDVPQVMRDAVVAAEDQRFYQHRGVDAQGVARAALENYREGETVQGGSTITQQYIKNAYLSGERTLSRKLREAVLATQLERQMTKDEILFNYLDTAYFGSGAYGVGAAAIAYFGKPVSQLTLSEAATLAGVIPSPTAWSPRVDREAAEQRRQIVLKVMWEQEMITSAQYQEALAMQLWLASDGVAPGPATMIVPEQTKTAAAYPHFVDWVEQLLLAKYGPDLLYRGGLRIETSIVPDVQAEAEAAVAARLANTEYPVDMALVAIDPATGLVKAMVAGRDYNVSQVNLATGGITGFQPGSSFKPIVLTAAFEKGIQPDTIYSAPVRFQVPFCEGEAGCFVYNYGGGGYGSMPLRQATWNSVNTVYAALTLDVGFRRVAEMANRLGIKSMDPNRTDYGVSLALGAYEVSPLEMANAYATLAAGGVYQPATPIVRIVDEAGHILEDNTARPGTRVLAANVAANVSDVLRGVIDSGTGRAASLGGRPAAGKTGTAENYQAAWFTGYTPQLATAVWMGHVDGAYPLQWVNGVGVVSGGSHPATAWGDFMRAALADQPVVEFQAPQRLEAELDEGFKAGAGQAGAEESEATRTVDTVPKAPAPAVPLVTPDDCGGPCKLYSGQLTDRALAAAPTPAPVTAPADTVAAPPQPTPSSAAPDASATNAPSRSSTSPTGARTAELGPGPAPISSDASQENKQGT